MPEPDFSTHKDYFFWGPPPTVPDVAIVIGNNREREIFEEIRLAKTHECGLSKQRRATWRLEAWQADLHASRAIFSRVCQKGAMRIFWPPLFTTGTMRLLRQFCDIVDRR
jgi:hypothetical protein